MTPVFGSVHPQMHRRFAAYACAAALVASFALMVACGGSAPAGGPGGGAPGGRGGPAMALPVDMVTLTPKPVEQTGEFVATVKSRRSTTITPQAEGTLTKIVV